jgi:hypothetical protein
MSLIPVIKTIYLLIKKEVNYNFIQFLEILEL